MKKNDYLMLEEELYDELIKLLKKFGQREDFDAGKFCFFLNKFAFRLNYDMTDNNLAATGLIAKSWNELLLELNDSRFDSIDMEDIFDHDLH